MKTALLSLLFLAPLALADSPTDVDRERRVAVALALAAADTTPPAATPRPSPVAALTECGSCSTDLEAARDRCRKDGTPVILFVGGCHGLGAELERAKVSASFVRADSYDRDGITPATCPRIVVIERRDGELSQRATLPAGVDAAMIKEIVIAPKFVAAEPGRLATAPVAATPGRIYEPSGCYLEKRGGVWVRFCPKGIPTQ